VAQPRRRLAIASSLLLIGIHLALFGSNLSNPGISQFDEFLSVDRTLGFLRTGDFLTTYTNCRPCWIKPPLQFYLGALSTKLGLTPVVALRLWSATFAALSLWLVVLLTLRLRPEQPWCAPTAVLFCASSAFFAEFTHRAMLETGYVFFILLAVYGVTRATENSTFWILWAAGCGFGTLQKVPMAWPISLIWMYGLYRSGSLPGLRALLRDKWFRVSLVLNLLLTAAWPMIQTIKYGAIYRRVAPSRWIFRLTTGVESHDGKGLGFNLGWLNWLLTDSWLFWVLTFAILIWVFCNPTLRQETSLWLLAPVVPVLLGFTFGGGPFGEYYILTFMPLVAVVTAILLGKLIQREHLLLLIALFVFLASGKNLAQANLHGADETLFDLRASCDRLSSHLRPGETPLFFAYDDPFSAAFGVLDQPIEICTVGKFPEAGQDYLAVVRLSRLDEIQQRWLGRSEVLETVGRFATVRLDSNRLPQDPGERL